MPVKHKPGKKIRNYELQCMLGNGGTAFAYMATKGGKKFFFKQYKQPAPAISWFKAYTKYTLEVKRRIEKDEAARTRCYEMVEFFVEKDFFQVFEFVEGGMSLKEVLDRSAEFSWEQKVIFAKVMVAAVDALHAADVGVVHTDLKPDNIYLIRDDSLSIGYRLKLIDFDFAILADQTAPWVQAKAMGYVGTPGYNSPEHLRGQTPLPASDVFTCGIMLGQLLCGIHPLGDKIEEIEANALSGQAKPFRIPEPIKKVEDMAFLEGVLNSTLCPDPARRPTAKQVGQALLGKVFAWDAWVPASPHASTASPPSSQKPPATPPVSAPPRQSATQPVASSLEILLEDRILLTLRVDTWLGKNHFLRFHEDARFLSNPQFRLSRKGGVWTIEHAPEATNATLVNGEKLEAPMAVTDGMKVAVGNLEKGVIKFPLTLRLCSKARAQ